MRWRLGSATAVVAGGLLVAGCGSGAAVLASMAPAQTAPPEPTNATVAVSQPSAASGSSTTGPTTTAVARPPIVIGFAGDTSFTDGLDQRDPFGRVIDLVAAPDLMVVNLETAVADPEVGRPLVDKPFLFRSPPASLDLLVAAGEDAGALANNHTLDFGADALVQTLDEIDDRGLLRVGAGVDEVAAYEPLIVDVGEWTVGLVSLSRVPCDWSASGENTRPQVAWACPAFLDLAAESARRTIDQADVSVVMIHGGDEGTLCPAPFMVDLVRFFAELGVDAVVNGHPHVLQGLTRIDQTWVAHSVGNFAFPSARGITGNSAIVQLHVSEEGVGLSLVPVRSDDGVLSVPTAAQRADILGQVHRSSLGVSVDPSGSVALDPGRIGDC